MNPDQNPIEKESAASNSGFGGYALGTALILLIGAGGYFMLFGKTAEAPAITDGGAVEVPSDLTGGEVSTNMPVIASSTPEMMVTDPIFHALVSFTDNGFEPKDTTIKKGETVRFVNNSSKDSWPASAIHPTHSIYPKKSDSDCLGSSFDACRGLKPGEFWEFTFDSVGTWRFHDHLNASKTGSVIVQ